ncbi:holin [Nonomuraea sp. FMUSA5-5]|uniref:Holin n=1 Tax=Nonomuraea composti TaxID=2720023 RepID=A0ABX1B7X9_9ACTN|nr:holin [Nonomuraea sp. FMUSA5-5]NJP93924.1 holin [Nonomuraea sp. FMUSA5-5]
MPHRQRKPCTEPGCPNLSDSGRCDPCRADAEAQRGTAAERGYGAGHRDRFRAGVLRKHPTCVLCRARPSRHADHYPLSRRQLEAAGEDPNDPRHGRGLCEPCHNTETARRQPGGWNAR